MNQLITTRKPKDFRGLGAKGLRKLGFRNSNFQIRISKSSFSLALLLLLAFDLPAQRLDITDVNSKSPDEPGFDLRLALGGAVNTDMTVSTRDGRSYPQQNISPLVGNCNFNGTISYESVAFNPGFRFDFAPGYRLNEWISFEFETGCTYNTVDSYTVSGHGTFT